MNGAARSFDWPTATLTLAFAVNTSIAAPTRIFANSPLYYDNQPPRVTVQPAGALRVMFVAYNRIELAASPWVAMHTPITVTVGPA